jgi:hypothetical protein
MLDSGSAPVRTVPLGARAASVRSDEYAVIIIDLPPNARVCCSCGRVADAVPCPYCGFPKENSKGA